MKPAYLISYDMSKAEICNIRRVEVRDEFEDGVSDVYGEHVPFCVGSNQTVRQVLTTKEEAWLRKYDNADTTTTAIEMSEPKPSNMWTVKVTQEQTPDGAKSVFVFDDKRVTVTAPVTVILYPEARYLSRLLLRFKNSNQDSKELFEKLLDVHDHFTFDNDSQRRIFRYNKDNDDFEPAGVVNEPQYTNAGGNGMLP